ncbi:ribokinase [Micromonospora sp. NPDC002575]|uniref:ribokinase n=1 Tax=Micromonospora sp. NPDC002575 TaxID=3364222 RepID=UPI00367D4C3D
MIDLVRETPKALVIGSVHHDRALDVPRLPKRGETVISGPARDGLGGKGANQAVAVARMGVSCELLGVVGDDDSAATVRDDLRAHGVSVARVGVVRGRHTGRATVVVEATGENLIIVEPGPVDRIDRAMVDMCLRDHATPPAVVVVQGEVPSRVIGWAAASADEAGTRFVLNLAPVIPVDPETLRHADPLVVNEHEAGHLLELLDGVPASVGDVDDALGMVRRLVAAGARSAVVTLGAAGAVLADGPTARHLAAFPAVVTDTTGAGDCFTGTLAAALATGQSLVEATRWGLAAASLAVGRPGAASAYPTREQAADVLRREAAPR